MCNAGSVEEGPDIYIQGVWACFTLALYAAFISLRHQPIVKIRDVRIVSVFMLIMTGLIMLLNCFAMLVRDR
jgi:hypothetical protein